MPDPLFERTTGGCNAEFKSYFEVSYTCVTGPQPTLSVSLCVCVCVCVIVYFVNDLLSTYTGGSVAEWLAWCWTQAQWGLGSNRSRATLSCNSLRQTVHTVVPSSGIGSSPLIPQKNKNVAGVSELRLDN